MQIELAIDARQQVVNIPDDRLLGILETNEVAIERRGAEAIAHALAHPIGTPRLCEIVKPGEKIAIITSDVTRPMPTYEVMPLLLDELGKAGIPDEDITLVFALGCHRKQTEAEMRKLAGDAVYERIRCVDGDLDDVVHLGQTKEGTPVDVVRVVAEADRRICLGNIEYHYFAGYSGGAKAIMPGVSTREAIQANHSKMVQEGAAAGNAEHNPVRADIEDSIRFCPIDFIVNIVLDEHKKTIFAVAGHFVKAHRVGCAFLDKIYLKEIEKRADIVICSQGGKPKDLNLYQTQKALDNAKHAVADGGIIILVGSCKEGLGEEVFAEWMEKAEKPEDLITWIQQNFQLGGHKAAAIAMVMQHADIYLVSDMEPDFVRSLFMEPFATVQAAYDAALTKLGPRNSTLVMPYGGSTLPRCRQGK